MVNQRKYRFWRWVCVAAFLVSLIYIFWSLVLYLLAGDWAPHAFPLIKNINMLPPHADMRWVTALSECGADLQALAEENLKGCDPYQRGGLGYPPLSVQIARFLGVKGSHTGILAFSMGLANVIILCLLVAQVVRDASLRALTACIFILGFPLQFALERGNIDVVIFNLFAAISALAATNHKKISAPFLALFSWTVVAIKIYPFPSILAWNLLDIFNKRRVQLFNIAILLGAIFGLGASLPWLISFGGSAARPDADELSHALISSYPLAQILGNKLSYNLNPPLISSLSRGWGVMAYLVSLVCLRKMKLNTYFSTLFQTAQTPFRSKFLYHFIGLCSTTWLTTYLLSGSYDYRMIFALPGFALIVSYAFSNFSSSRQKLLLIAMPLAVATILLSPLPMVFLGKSSKIFYIGKYICWLADYFLIPFIAASLTMMLAPVNWGRGKTGSTPEPTRLPIHS